MPEVISDQKREVPNKFKKNDKIKFTAANELGQIEDFQGVIDGRAGKANGKWKNCYNVLYESPEDVKGSIGWMDFDRVDNIDHVEELQECFVSEIPTNVDFKPAKKKELDSWLDLGVYEPVSDCGQKTIDTRWVLTLKKLADGSEVPKARLVARGFLEKNIAKHDKESPVVTREVIRIFLSIAEFFNWEIVILDVKTAFLQSDKLNRDVFIRPPLESEQQNVLWRLKKPVYGLKDASKHWFSKVLQVFSDYGLKQCETEPSLFTMKTDSSELEGLVLSHVDDFLITGTHQFRNSFVSSLKRTFTIGSESRLPLMFTGLAIKKEADGTISVSQEKFVENLFQMDFEPGTHDVLSEREVEAFRSLVENFSGSAVRQARISVSVLIHSPVVMACVSIALNSPTS